MHVQTGVEYYVFVNLIKASVRRYKLKNEKYQINIGENLIIRNNFATLCSIITQWERVCYLHNFDLKL